MLKYCLKIYIFFIFCAALAKNIDFNTSFITSYDLSGRYTHEYHPFFLDKTCSSFLKLEQFLQDNNFSINGRLLIVGYQEDAVPPYKTQLSREAIADEVTLTSRAGISQPAKNIFGFMTGFLLKDAQWLENYWFNANTKKYIEHIVASNIELFNDQALLFQKHAFGKDFDRLIQARDAIEQQVYARKPKEILRELINFWTYLFKCASVTGSQEVVGTQDMLFSIEYARALLDGSAPIEKIFVGPDITYPIEVLECQKVQATIHAQKFIEIFTNYLMPVNNEPTAYIFCSFVDGVGKSTLLNNIKNWSEFGNNYNNYKRCDNSSSQEAELSMFKENVAIVDLPAQLSHYAIKPDGFVFSDVQTVRDFSKQEIEATSEYITIYRQKLIYDFEELLKNLTGSDKALYEEQDPIVQYAHNCVILGKELIEWIPARFDNNIFLFHKNNSKNLRILVPLAGVHSTGLKVVEPEQMLFSKGLSLPMKYTDFLENLKQKLTRAGIKHVYFVDFLSMYPRTSRENIRINFVLQYLKKVFGDNYIFDKSFYKHTVHRAQEICYLLQHDLDAASQMISLETALRNILFSVVENTAQESLNILSGKELEDLLKAKTAELLNLYGDQLLQTSKERLLPEQEIYAAKYSLDKTYENIIRFSPEALAAFSKEVTGLFNRNIKNDTTQQLWSDMNGMVEKNADGTYVLADKENTGSKTAVMMRHSAALGCKDEEKLREFVRCVRAQYYGQLSLLLDTQADQDGLLKLDTIKTEVPPFTLVIDNNKLLMLQKEFPVVDTRALEKPLETPIKFHIIDIPGQPVKQWGLYDDTAYCLNWDNPATYFGIYAFGYSPFNTPKNTLTRLVESYQKNCVQAGNNNWLLPLSAYTNLDAKELEAIKADMQALNKNPVRVITPDDPAVPGIQLWLRAIATLEMIVKDTKSDLCVRRGNKEDFVAALKLLQEITLPAYFGISCQTPLFTDYAQVEPLIGWDLL